jgi:enoyl-CoA hydratase/carnithine racemase
VTELVLTRIEGAVMEIELNRPEVRNALIPDVTNGLAAAFEWAGKAEGVSVVRLSGRGRSFCAGGDAKFKGADFRSGWAAFEAAVGAMAACPKPIVARVQGHAIGAGCALALLSDFVLTESTARFEFPFVRMGLVPEGMQRVARLLRPVDARRFVFLGQSLEGARAEEVGLVHRAVDPSELDAATAELIGVLVALPGPALERIKRGLELAASASLAETLAWEGENQAELRSDPGYEEFRARYFEGQGVSTKPKEGRTQR